MNVLVTGINGFVGKVLANKLAQEGVGVVGTVRSEDKKHFVTGNVVTFTAGEINEETDWKQALNDIDVVVHLAARVHMMHDTDTNLLDLYRQVNVAGTQNLAQQARKAGVKRFVYLSSIKVNGEENWRSYTEDDIPAPKEPYGISKWEAEQILWDISAQSAMEVVVIRPPLVYGAEVKANFLRLLALVNKGIPLPFGSLRNKRSMVFVGNLVSAISLCMGHPGAAGQTFIVSDNQDLSVAELLEIMAKKMGKRLRLIPVPSTFIDILASLVGRSNEVQRLTKSLCVDSSLIRKTIGWTPPYTVEEGIKETVEWYKRACKLNCVTTRC